MPGACFLGRGKVHAHPNAPGWVWADVHYSLQKSWMVEYLKRVLTTEKSDSIRCRTFLICGAGLERAAPAKPG